MEFPSKLEKIILIASLTVKTNTNVGCGTTAGGDNKIGGGVQDDDDDDAGNRNNDDDDDDSGHNDDDEHDAKNGGDDDTVILLFKWNDEIETYLASPPSSSLTTSSSSSSQQQPPSKQLLELLSDRLTEMIVYHHHHHHASSSSNGDSPCHNNNEHDSLSSSAAMLLLESIRAGKNLLRWYHQIYVEYEMKKKEQPTTTDRQVNPLISLQQPSTIRLIADLLYTSVIMTTTKQQQQQQKNQTSSKRLLPYPHGSRHASLFLFYATYSISPSTDPIIQNGFETLLNPSSSSSENCNNNNDSIPPSFPTMAVEMLVRCCCEGERDDDEDSNATNNKGLSESIPLALSIVRNIHNIVVSVPTPQLLDNILHHNTNVDVTFITKNNNNNNNTTTDSWTIGLSPKETSSENGENGNSTTTTTTLDFVSICIYIVNWCLQQQKVIEDSSHDETNNANDSHTTETDESKRYELISEIFNVLYALRVGKQLSSRQQQSTTLSSSTTNDDGPIVSLATVVCNTIRLLQPPQPPNVVVDKSVVEYTEEQGEQIGNNKTTTTATSITKLQKQCRLAAVSLLMDSDPSFVHCLVSENNDQISHDVISSTTEMTTAAITTTTFTTTDSLLQILNEQVMDVVDNVRVDNSATASIVPIMVVLNKYCSFSNSKAFLQYVKRYIFPPNVEKMLKEERQKIITTQPPSSGSSNTNNAGQRPNNMSPLMDVPQNTLRGRLVTLLSWPESYIKRCTAEFVWTLCEQNSNEYIERVGMGNAMPLLMSKGVIPMQIPS